MNVPLATNCAHKASFSSWEPSTQWIAAGFVSSAIFSTQRSKCWFVPSGVDGWCFFMAKGAMNFSLCSKAEYVHRSFVLRGRFDGSGPKEDLQPKGIYRAHSAE